MFEGNWGNKPERCLVEDAFKALVVEPVVRCSEPWRVVIGNACWRETPVDRPAD